MNAAAVALFLLALLILLDIAAWLGSTESRDPADSTELEHRRTWPVRFP